MAQRNTTTRDLHRKQIRRGKPDCALCGLPIDYDAPHLDPGEFTVDHITPLNKGGEDTLENKQAAHRACNRAKSDSMLTDGLRMYVTERQWSPRGAYPTPTTDSASPA